MEDNGILVVVLIALVSMSAFFSASETAYTGLNRARLKNMASSGNRRAMWALKLSENYDKLLSGILVGNNIVNILSASLATILFVRLIGSAGVSVSTAVMTVLVLMFGEIAPKSIAREHPERIALAFSPALSFILKLLAPFIFLAGCWQKLIHRLFRPSSDRGITEEDLITIVTEAEHEGEIDEHEGELIRSAIEFNDLTAEDILTPRVDIIAVELHDDREKITRIFQQSGRSRVPVYEGNIDNIIGILHEKDFYRLSKGTTLEQIMTDPLCVVTTTGLSALLKLLQKTKNHMAVVMDEYGGVSGIVTMEDILEVLVGEIWDEHDQVVESFRHVDGGGLLVSGSASLDDLRELYPIDERFDSVTVNGWVLEVLGHFPRTGDVFEYNDLKITIMKVSRRRVEQILIEGIHSEKAGVNS